LPDDHNNNSHNSKNNCDDSNNYDFHNDKSNRRNKANATSAAVVEEEADLHVSLWILLMCMPDTKSTTATAAAATAAAAAESQASSPLVSMVHLHIVETHIIFAKQQQNHDPHYHPHNIVHQAKAASGVAALRLLETSALRLLESSNPSFYERKQTRNTFEALAPYPGCTAA
jgi:hypothetical protein